MDANAHIVVSGMVQGVGYRYFVYRLAKRMNLTGWVKNLPNGEVEIEVEGQKGIIESFMKELPVGNSSAVVRNIEVNWEKPVGQYRNFDITF